MKDEQLMAGLKELLDFFAELLNRESERICFGELDFNGTIHFRDHRASYIQIKARDERHTFKLD